MIHIFNQNVVKTIISIISINLIYNQIINENPGKINKQTDKKWT